MASAASRPLHTIIITVVFALALSAAHLPAHATEEASSVEVYRTSIMESYIGSNNHFVTYKTSDQRAAYDYDLTRKAPEDGTSFALTDEWDSGVQYILDNAPYINAGEEFRSYITQAAIWWYRNPDDISSDFTESDTEAYAGVRNGIVKLVNEARVCSTESPTKSDYFSKKLYSVTCETSERLHSVKRDGITYYESPIVRVEWSSSALTEFVSITPAVNGVTVVEVEEGDNGPGSFDVAHEEPTKYLTFRLRIPEGLVDAFLQNPTMTFECNAYINLMQVYEADDPNTSRFTTLSNLSPTDLEFSRSLDTAGWTSSKNSAAAPFGIAVIIGVALLIAIIAVVSRVSSRRH